MSQRDGGHALSRAVSWSGATSARGERDQRGSAKDGGEGDERFVAARDTIKAEGPAGVCHRPCVAIGHWCDEIIASSPWPRRIVQERGQQPSETGEQCGEMLAYRVQWHAKAEPLSQSDCRGRGGQRDMPFSRRAAHITPRASEPGRSFADHY
jgi:hypothetical protein